MIDLHTHTTASDGRCTPAELCQLAWKAGLRVLGVTDHDTMTGVPAARAAAVDFGLEILPGIEITSVLGERDVHVLGYWLDPTHPDLDPFLQQQRRARVERVYTIAERLAGLGKPVDVDAILAPLAENPDWAPGRPAIARALVAAGHVSSVAEAFETLIAEGRPGWAPRPGATPEEVIRFIRRLGGVASLAHPGLNGRDELIAGWVGEGLQALEVYHSEHDAEAVARYRAMAGDLGLLVTGGSDFHADGRDQRAALGGVTLPEDDYARFRALAPAAAS